MIDPKCNADLDHPCDGGKAADEDGEGGEPCASCKAAYDYWHAYFAGMPRSYTPLSKEELDEQLRDAGRGHLVRP